MQVSIWLSNIVFICDLLGFKLWLLSIQNHARDCSPALRTDGVTGLFDWNLNILTGR